MEGRRHSGQQEVQFWRSEDRCSAAFSHNLVSRRGQVDQAEIEALRTAGYSDGEIAEIITNVGLNTFTNYFNNAVQTEIDFPKIDLKKAA